MATIVRKLHSIEHIILVLPILGLHEEAEVESSQGSAPTLTSAGVHVYDPVLFHQVIQSFRSFKEIIHVFVSVFVVDWTSDVVFDSFALIPELQLILVQASLLHHFVRHQVEDGIDLRLANQAVDVDLKERVRSGDNFGEVSTFMDLIEEETFKEGAISLLNIAIHDVDIILNLPVVRIRVLNVADLATIGMWIS